MLNVIIRPAAADDVNFIMSSYLRSLSNQAPYDLLDTNYFNASGHLLANRIMAVSTIIMACSSTDPSHIYGWIAGDKQKRTLHWVYVKNVFRHAGIGKMLMEALFEEYGATAQKIRCTNWTRSMAFQDRKWNLYFDSYPLVLLARGE